MPYIGQPPVSGDTTKSFRLLDNLASFTLSFDATSSSVVDTTANTLTFANHRFVTAQRVTYADGGGTAIGGLTDGTAYFIIKVDQNTIQLASSASNANNGTAISLSSGAVGSHTLNLAFDGTNTKFKATYANGTKAKISRAGQLLISINGVLQQAQESSTPTLGFGLDSDSTIVFSQAPVSTDVLFGQILADTITNFDTQDNTLDVFTGDGSTVNFNLSKKPASNNDILVTLDGVVQYPTTTSTSNAYSVTESTLTFTAAPADGVAIQVRHIGFAGATSSAVTGLYGRTGNVTLSSSDDDITVGNVTAGIITATSFGSISGTTASFSGNVSIGGTLTYEDVTNIDAVGLITARSGVKFGESGTTIFGNSTGIGIGEASPTRKLVVAGDTNTVAVVRGATNGTSNLFLGDTDDEDIGALTYNHPSNYLSATVNASERLRITSAGRVLLGHTSNVNNKLLQITTSNGAALGLLNYQATDDGPEVTFIKSRNGTKGSHTVVNNGDFLGRIFFRGSDGDSYERGVEIAAQVDGTPGDGDMPGRLMISTTADGASTPTERMRIDSSGNVQVSTGQFTVGTTASTGLQFINDGTFGTIQSADLIFRTASAERMRIDTSGRLMLGTTTEGEHTADDLTVATSGDTGITIRSGTSNSGRLFFSDGTSSADEYRGFLQYTHSNNTMLFGTDATERMRIDSSGRVMISQTDASYAASYADDLIIGTTSGDRGMTIVSQNVNAGTINFSDGTSADDKSRGIIQYDHGGNFMRFYTNSGERARITAGSEFIVGKTSAGVANNGGELRDGSSDYAVVATAAGHIPLIVNRNTNDGGLIRFRQANSDEGDISISGSTVSYNGAHLSRWSQLAGGAERIEILRGSVLSNLDEMCEWGEEDNEQLNRMKVSDVEGDPNVSGVFQDWDDDDDTYINDFYCAMTGDFVIRIAQGTTVALGDLLMSAGDGTAKPQDDDIVRSKTVAKVTSTTVSTTYSDGSYCVPCVLMAC